jgi:hypothetical protein
MNNLPQKNRRTILCHSQERMFEVVDVEGAGIFLWVVCGGIAMYERCIRLEESEISAFRESGESALYSLAYEVTKDKHEEREWIGDRHAPK